MLYGEVLLIRPNYYLTQEQNKDAKANNGATALTIAKGQSPMAYLTGGKFKMHWSSCLHKSKKFLKIGHLRL